MKKFLILCLIFLLGNISYGSTLLNDILAEDSSPKVLTANIVFDWLDITQIDRDKAIEKYKSELFGEETILKYNKKEFRSEYKDFLKDSDFKRHYMLVKNNVKETDYENLCGFYKGRTLISYAVQYKKDLKTVYYYDALGHLRYIDKFSENYPNYPYMSKQYRSNGTLVSAIYFMSHDMQYMYGSDRSFTGVWYKEKMYNRHAKQVLTRSNW